MYATITRPDISYVVWSLSQFMQHPKKSHLEAANRVIRYLKGTIGQGIWLKSQTTAELTFWCDSDWTVHAPTQEISHVVCNTLLRILSILEIQEATYIIKEFN